MEVELPVHLEVYNVEDDSFRDMRDGKLLTAEERRKYVSFTAWFEERVQNMIEKGCVYHHAPAFLASALLQHYLQTTVRN